MAGVLVPEEHGGLGLGLLEAALIAEALGKHVAPVPFLGTAVMAPLALMLAGSAGAAETHGCRSWRQAR